jgi:hypothetical protein
MSRITTVIRTRVIQARRTDVGAATAEYAVATVAACGFGGVLLKILTSEPILQLVRNLITTALRAVL